ncbi:hypothetical protein [Pimelobacter sp. 30-1]|uniref:hypothetical protein n=1 Tax=Pimelobacter sp. 30-1 TaxID=2004991 RepID=UPI001C03EBA3|nr:hypothetical protein [Pimelobacter sp. 30-1]MBU2695129.1 hypothetical protein [Pimelobacter sp. 30-1]
MLGPALTSLADALVKSSDTIVDRAEAECMGTRLIDDVGTDQLVTWGVLDKSKRTANLSDGPDELAAALVPALSQRVGLAETPEDLQIRATIDEDLPKDVEAQITRDWKQCEKDAAAH